MLAWFEGLSPRERGLVMAAAVALVITLLFTQVWLPLNRGIQSERATQQEQRELLAWIESKQPALQQLRAAGNPAAAGERAEGTLLVLADRSAKQAGLSRAIKRTNPESNGGVRVVMEDASFNDVIAWLATLRRQHAVDVANLSTTAKDQPGIVDVMVSLREVAP